MRPTIAVILSGIAVLAAACGSSPSSSSANSAPPPAVGSSTGPAAAPSAKTMTAAQITQALKAHGLPLTLVRTYTAADDPNHLLGRPGGYTSKVAFSDPRANPGPGTASDALERGGSVEVYADHDGAVRRARYIQTVTQAMPIAGVEYDYVAGGIVLRVTGKMTPDVAARYASALATIAGPVVTPSPTHS